MTKTEAATHVTRLLAAASRTEAQDILDNLTVAQLRQVADTIRDGGLAVMGRPTKANLSSSIVEYAVGRNLDSRSIGRVGGRSAY